MESECGQWCNLRIFSQALLQYIQDQQIQGHLQGLLVRYKYWAHQHPYINCITSAFLQGFIGDLLAQFIIEPRLTGKYQRYKISRTGRIVFQAVCLNCVHLQTWLFFVVPFVQNVSFVQDWIKDTTGSYLIGLISVVLLDEVPWSISLNCYVLFTSNFIRFGDLEKSKRFVKDNIWAVMKVNWCVWPFAQFIDFMIIPKQHRYLFDAIVNIIWQCFMSFKTQNTKYTGANINRAEQ